jgi:hypothetical protein
MGKAFVRSWVNKYSSSKKPYSWAGVTEGSHVLWAWLFCGAAKREKGIPNNHLNGG